MTSALNISLKASMTSFALRLKFRHAAAFIVFSLSVANALVQLKI
jgi:hypothetical protein